MRLTPREVDGLMIYVAADLARKRQARGLKLNYPEAVALISEAMMEAARDGKSVTEAAFIASTLLTRNDVMDGIPELIDLVQIEATFPDGTKLVSCHHPIQPTVATADFADDSLEHYLFADGDIELNAGREKLTLMVANTGDRPIQVGSHAHFFEVNRALRFDRASTFGFRLDIPASTAMRFEPGDEREVTLVAFGGARRATGMSGLSQGRGRDETLVRAREQGFIE
ncbi:MAG: urease subunit gamma [Dehalococcoidia bacterium]